MGFAQTFFDKKTKGIDNSENSSVNHASFPLRTTSIRSQCTNPKELEHVFKKFDVNNDGKISLAELSSIMGSLGQHLSEEELLSMIKEVDADGDGFIDLNEFIALNTKGIDSDEVLNNLKEAFSIYDADGNGKITAEELQKVMKNLGDDFSISECRKMIRGVDTDGDGTINFEEFKVMMIIGVRLNSVS